MLTASNAAARTVSRRVAYALIWLTLVLTGAGVVHGSEVDQQASLDRLLETRAETSAKFVESYALDVFRQNAVFAEQVLQGSIRQADFERLMAANGIKAAVVTNDRGRALALYPANPKLLGTDLAQRYAHLKRALSGRSTASNVVPSAVLKIPIVGFATPFDSPVGRRVFSPAYEVSSTPLATYLANEAGESGEAVYLVDGDGGLVSAGGPRVGPASRLSEIDDGLSAAAQQSGLQVLTVQGEPWRAVTLPVSGTPWRIMIAAPTRVLYASISKAELWTARLGLAAFALAGLGLIALLERMLQQRSLVAEEQRRAAQAADHARDVALAASAAKSAFLATMSHEIRTPMNAVIGMTALLMDTRLDSQQHEFAETVRVSGESLLGVINDILDFSKIEAGELQLDHQPFLLVETVEQCVDLVAVSADTKGLELVPYVDGSCPRAVLGDQRRLSQVLVNLLSNAVKFTASGSVALRVSASAGPTAQRLSFEVSDTGIGIPEDRIPALFDPFSQLDASTTRKYGGTGLGLAISRRLVDAMGGELSATSALGVGSTFTVSVPLPEATLADDHPSKLTGMSSASLLVGKRVLVVHHNPTSRRILSLQLTGSEMVCTSAASATAALALLNDETAYDVALLDTELLGPSYRELVTALRALPGSKDLPLVLLSRLGAVTDEGPNSWSVSKPAKQSTLLAALSNAMSAAPRRGASSSGPAPSAPGPLRPLRVLLAEDNPVNQRVAELMLGRLGHQVDTVCNGEEAVAAMQLAPYDVVLMDLQMPVMDGLEATRRIRSELSRQRQPYIVAMTASALVEDRKACMAAGMDDYLPKPFREAELRRSVDRTLAATSPAA